MTNRSISSPSQKRNDPGTSVRATGDEPRTSPRAAREHGTACDSPAFFSGQFSTWLTSLRRWVASTWVLSACSFLVPASGCGPSSGALLYFLGVGGKEKVKAQFTLSPGPILILVDDFNESLLWPEVRDQLALGVANELLDHKATGKIVSNDDLVRLRQAHSNFDARGCREVGQMLDADQVLWIEVTDFFASEQIEDAGSAARLAVTVKVINARATRPDEVRLWPPEHEGCPLRADLTANQVNRAKQRNAIAQELTTRLARDVGRLFYEHTLEDLASS